MYPHGITAAAGRDAQDHKKYIYRKIHATEEGLLGASQHPCTLPISRWKVDTQECLNESLCGGGRMYRCDDVVRGVPEDEVRVCTGLDAPFARQLQQVCRHARRRINRLVKRAA